jgi:hypothetical protein
MEVRMRGTGGVVFAATLLVIVVVHGIAVYGEDEAALGGEDERALGA